MKNIQLPQNWPMNTALQQTMYTPAATELANEHCPTTDNVHSSQQSLIMLQQFVISRCQLHSHCWSIYIIKIEMLVCLTAVSCVSYHADDREQRTSKRSELRTPSKVSPLLPSERRDGLYTYNMR